MTTLLLEDLIIWTNYEIEVAAYNGAGLGTFSHKVTEWTLQGGKHSIALSFLFNVPLFSEHACILFFTKFSQAYL